jgi:hypothetical protein
MDSILSGVVKVKGEYHHNSKKYSVLEIDNGALRNYAMASYDKYIQNNDKIAFDKGEIVTPTTGSFKGADIYIVGEDVEVVIDDSDEAINNIFINIYKSRYATKYNEVVDSMRQYGLASISEYLYKYSEALCSEDEIYRWWYTNRILRRLWHLKLDYKLLDKAKEHYLCETAEVYYNIIKYPLSALFLPVGECIRICERYEVQYEDMEVTCAHIARSIYDELINSKNTYVLLSKIRNIWGVENLNGDVLKMLRSKFGVVHTSNIIQLKYAYKAELNIANHFKQLASLPSRNLEPVFEQDCNLDKTQRLVVEKSLNSPLFIYTGGPGRGKSHILKYTVMNIVRYKLDYVILCPTAKAAARVRDLAGEDVNAMTIHMFIKSRPEEPDIIIWDECSMTSTNLVHYTLSRCTKASQIFLGDPEQLPPVAWGEFFKQVLKTSISETIELKKNYRSTKDVFSLDVNGNLVETKDCSIKEGTTLDVMVKYRDMVAAGVKMTDICIITSKNVHVEEINIQCQLLNKNKEFVLERSGRKFVVGDKVILRKNRYKYRLWNGDIGIVTSADQKNKNIVVSFKLNREIKFRLSNDQYKRNLNYIPDDELVTDLLELAYSMTVYSAQGDEWPYIIFYTPVDVPMSLFNYNTIRTALTRAKLSNYVIGSIDKLQKAIKYRPASPMNLLTIFIEQN